MFILVQEARLDKSWHVWRTKTQRIFCVSSNHKPSLSWKDTLFDYFLNLILVNLKTIFDWKYLSWIYQGEECVAVFSSCSPEIKFRRKIANILFYLKYKPRFLFVLSFDVKQIYIVLLRCKWSLSLQCCVTVLRDGIEVIGTHKEWN